MKDLEDVIKPYQEMIYDMYWNDKMSFAEISKTIGIASGPTLYRYMKKHSIVRSKEQQLKDLQISNTGREWTEETKRNVSIGVKKSYNENLRKIRSEDNKRIWADMNYEQRLKRTHNGITAAREKALKLSSSSIEEKVAKQLDELGLKYKRQKRLNKCKFYVDFYLPKYNLVIECNGDYWHKLPDRVKRDRDLKMYVENTGHKIIFVWEHDIRDESFWIGDYLEREVDIIV